MNISSVAGLKHSTPYLFTHSVSKAFANKLTQALAYKLADKGIQVNGILLGMMDTSMINRELKRLYDGDIQRMRKDRDD